MNKINRLLIAASLVVFANGAIAQSATAPQPPTAGPTSVQSANSSTDPLVQKRDADKMAKDEYKAKKKAAKKKARDEKRAAKTDYKADRADAKTQRDTALAAPATPATPAAPAK